MKDHIHPERCLSYMKQLWSCLIFLRDNNIIHRDIKPENLLVFDQGYTIKLTDFGWGYVIDKSNDYKKPCGEIAGTPDYIAPEIMLELEHDHRCDLWSSGIFFYELITGVPPTDELSMEDTMKIIKTGFIELKTPIETNFNMWCFGIIKKILQYDPNHRPTLEYCLEYLNNNNYSYLLIS